MTTSFQTYASRDPSGDHVGEKPASFEILRA
jgi:hypothetical protein